MSPTRDTPYLMVTKIPFVSKGDRLTTRTDVGLADDGTGQGWRVSISWQLLKGRPEPVAMTIEGYPESEAMSGAVVRGLPLGEVIAAARQACRDRLDRQRRQWENPVARAVFRLNSFQVTPDPLLWAFEVAQGPRRGNTLTDDELRAVAAVYRDAYEKGEGVTKAVATAFVIEKSTAAKRIQKARAAGFLDGIGPDRVGGPPARRRPQRRTDQEG